MEYTLMHKSIPVLDFNLGELTSSAPIFDSGSSLGYDKLPNQILTFSGVECKPFKKTHEEQLRLVTSFDWIDFDRLNGIDEDIRKVFDQAGEYVSEERKSAIISAFSSRIDKLIILSNRQIPKYRSGSGKRYRAGLWF